MRLLFSFRHVWRNLSAFILVAALVAVGIPAQAATTDTGSITGTISGAPGVDVKRLSVSAIGLVDGSEWGHAWTAADGTYTMVNVPTGTYKIRVGGGRSGGYDTWYGGAVSENAKTVTVPSNQVLTGIDVVVPLGATVSGRVSVPEGFLVSKVLAEAFWGYTPATQLFSHADAQGNYEIRGLAPGTYIINFRTNEALEQTSYHLGGGSTGFTLLNIAGSENLTGIDVTMLKSSSISGKVTLPPGVSTDGLKVSARREDNNVEGRGSISPDGSFQITGLYEGKYRIRFEAGTTGLVDQWYSDGTGTGSATSIDVPQSTDVGGVNLTLVQTPSFGDVAPGTAFFDEISWLAARGVTGGFPDGTFRPLDVIHRDAMAAFIYRAAGRPEFTPPAVSPFRDLATSDPFYKEITWLKSKGITKGYPDGTYRPLGAINRDAMAAFLYRMAGGVGCAFPLAEAPAEIPVFTDNPVGGSFHNEIQWMASCRISTGYADGSFKPSEPVHRDAMAAFIKRLSVQPGYLGLN
ncbi:hypothetical protein GCM10027038_09430 [Arthrobacter bambusae]